MNETRKRRFNRLFWELRLKIPFRQRPKRPVFGWLFVFLYCSLIIYLLYGPAFKIQHAECYTNSDSVCPDFVVPELQRLMGKSIFMFRDPNIETKILNNLPQAEKVEVKQEWPHTVTALITWQHPIAYLSIPASTSAYIVGSAKQLISITDTIDSHLPTIVASSAADLILSDRILDPSLASAVDIILEDRGTVFTVNKINVVNPDLIKVTGKDGYVVYFTGLKPIKEQVHTLQLILSQIKMKAELPVIDVRLDRPTLKPIQ